MPANTAPIWTLTPRIGWGSTDGDGGSAGPLKTANTAKDGTGTVLTIFTAGANGSFIQAVRFRAAGTNTATVARIFINNGGVNSTLANNILVDEITLTGTTLSEVAATSLYEQPLNFAINASYKVMVTIGTTVAAGYCVSCIGGDY